MKNRKKLLYLCMSLFSIFTIVSLIMLTRSEKSNRDEDINILADYIDYE